MGIKFTPAKREELFELIRREGLTPRVERAVVEIYGERGKKALRAVKEGRVHKNGVIWVVEGKTDTYEIVKDLCYCMDFTLNIVTGRAGVDMCYHILAKKICEILHERTSG
jgi:predicted nucleic acid-binding Zn finger protein